MIDVVFVHLPAEALAGRWMVPPIDLRTDVVAARDFCVWVLVGCE
jgi:hypothetical protein